MADGHAPRDRLHRPRRQARAEAPGRRRPGRHPATRRGILEDARQGGRRVCPRTRADGEARVSRPPATIRWVDTAAGLAALLGELGRPARIAVDTEAASYHRYSDRICLVQLSTPAVTAVVDALAVPDLSAFGTMLADPAVE